MRVTEREISGSHYEWVWRWPSGVTLRRVPSLTKRGQPAAAALPVCRALRGLDAN
jgi:hypothetical protein